MLEDFKSDIKTFFIVAIVAVIITVGGILLLKATQTSNTVDWQTYRSEKFGFELKYPEEWKFFEDRAFSTIYFSDKNDKQRTEISITSNEQKFRLRRLIKEPEQFETGYDQLKYEIDPSTITDSERELAMQGLEALMKMRLGKLGIDNRMIYRNGSGVQKDLVIEIPQTDNVAAVTQTVAQIPFLEIRETKENYQQIIEANEKALETGRSDLEEPFRTTSLNGMLIEKLEVRFDEQQGSWIITLWFNSEGTVLLRDITTRHIGDPLAIYVDGVVITAPVVQHAITNGKVEITGGFFSEEEIGNVAGPMKVAITPLALNLLSNITCRTASVFDGREGWECEGESWSARGKRISAPAAQSYGVEFEAKGKVYELAVVFEESQRQQVIELFNQVLSTFQFVEPFAVPDLQTYRNEKYGFEIKYPSNWFDVSWKEERAGNVSIFSNSPSGLSDSGETNTIELQIVVSSADGIINFNELEHLHPGEVLYDKPKEEGIAKVSDLTIAGYPAVKVRFPQTFYGAQGLFGSDQVWVKKGTVE